MQLDYKCTMMNPHCAEMSDEILENEDEQMSKFCLEAELPLEQIHCQLKIQMAYTPKAWEVGKSLVDEEMFQHSNMASTVDIYPSLVFYPSDHIGTTFYF
jgi:hypothetical protein